MLKKCAWMSLVASTVMVRVIESMKYENNSGNANKLLPRLEANICSLFFKKKLAVNNFTFTTFSGQFFKWAANLGPNKIHSK